MEHEIGPVEALPTDACVAVADGRAVAVRVGDEVVAFHPNCLHRASSLAGGLVVRPDSSGEQPKLQCPLHFWRYHLPSGVHTGGRGVLRSYPVTVRDGRAFVDLPEAAPAVSVREQLLAHARNWDRDAAPQPRTSRGADCLEVRAPGSTAQHDESGS